VTNTVIAFAPTLSACALEPAPEETVLPLTRAVALVSASNGVENY
jgi:hypothetical protein